MVDRTYVYVHCNNILISSTNYITLNNWCFAVLGEGIPSIEDFIQEQEQRKEIYLINKHIVKYILEKLLKLQLSRQKKMVIFYK